MDDLKELSLEELRAVKNKNLLYFNIMLSVDLIVFYYSLFYEKWALLFVSFGIFVAGLALYDNYRLTKTVLEQHTD